MADDTPVNRQIIDEITAPRVSDFLTRLRAFRDAEDDVEMRRVYNEACDRLAVLENKLYRRMKNSE